jgi:hypothetical protein
MTKDLMNPHREHLSMFFLTSAPQTLRRRYRAVHDLDVVHYHALDIQMFDKYGSSDVFVGGVWSLRRCRAWV